MGFCLGVYKVGAAGAFSRPGGGGFLWGGSFLRGPFSKNAHVGSPLCPPRFFIFVFGKSPESLGEGFYEERGLTSSKDYP